MRLNVKSARGVRQISVGTLGEDNNQDRLDMEADQGEFMIINSPEQSNLSSIDT